VASGFSRTLPQTWYFGSPLSSLTPVSENPSVRGSKDSRFEVWFQGSAICSRMRHLVPRSALNSRDQDQIKQQPQASGRGDPD
jgi:hypothetical protein